MELGLVGMLFITCTEAYSRLGKSGHYKDSAHLGSLKNEAIRFDIWGGGFKAVDGGLDELLTLHVVGDLRDSCLIILGSIGHVFIGHIFTTDDQTTIDESDFIGVLRILLEKTEGVTPELLEYRYGEEGGDQEAIEELKDLNDCLFDMVPFLEREAALSVKPRGLPLVHDFSGNIALQILESQSQN